MKANIQTLYAAGAVLAGLVVLYVIVAPRQAGRALGRVAAGTVGNVVAGTAEGVGDAIGLPVTDLDKCRGCIAARDWWRASVYCPAGTFIAARLGSSGKPAPTRNVVTPGDYVGDLPIDDAPVVVDGYYGTPGA